VLNLKKNMSLNCMLLGGVSVLAMGAFSAPAMAQATDGTTAAPVETVVVTGIRASLKSAQSIKQNSDQMVDSVTAVDIGALPDRSVAEALQRIPGVTVQRTDQNRDPVRFAGAPNSVFIRGLAWVQSELNGRDVFSAANGRSLSFGDVSSDLLAGVDVYKNPDAKMIEGGVGGTVDLRTRRPFDQDGRKIAFSAEEDYGDLYGRGKPSFNGLFSDRWNTNVGEVGALLSIDYQDLATRSNGIALDHYDCVDISSNTVVGQHSSAACNAVPTANRRFIPDTISWRQIDWEQKRSAIDAALQWRSPNGKWESTLDVLVSIADPHDVEHTQSNNSEGQQQNYPTYTYAADGTWTGGTQPNALETGDTRIGRRHESTGSYSWNTKFNPNDSWALSADVEYTESEATNYSMTGFTGLTEAAFGTGTPVEAFNVNLTGSLPVITQTPVAGTTAQANSFWLAMMDHLEDNFAHSWAYRGDATYTFHDEEGWLKSLDVGFRGDNKIAVTRQTGYNWSMVSALHDQTWMYPTAPIALSSTGFDSTHQSPTLPQQSEYYNFGDFFGGPAPGTGWYATPTFLSQGTNHVFSLIQNAEPWGQDGFGGWGWVPYAEKSSGATPAPLCANGADVKCLPMYGTGVGPRNDNVSAGVNNQNEDIVSGYAQLNWGHDSILGINDPIDGNVGVRVVSTTDTTPIGPTLAPGGLQLASCVATLPAIACTDLANATTFSSGGNLVSPSVHNTYVDVLPSFNARLHLSDDLQARVAISKAIVRPDFSQTQNYTQLAFGFGPNNGPGPLNLTGTFATNGTAMTGTGGNPFLKPMHATQYDASLEWYFAPTGSLTFAGFHKDLTNYFISAVAPESYTDGGKTYTFNVTRTRNGSHGSVEGFELSYQQFYDSLPGVWGGLGVQANFTKIYSSGGANPTVNLFETVEIGNAAQPLPLEGMSPNSYNLALMYEKYGISARLAYNWRSAYLLTSSAANVNQPVWSENYGQLDGSIFYSFLDHYKVGIQGTNLLKTNTILDVGYADYHPRYDWIETDRTLSLVLRANW
jgi:TonB-dependent receptor